MSDMAFLVMVYELRMKMTSRWLRWFESIMFDQCRRYYITKLLQMQHKY